MAQELDFPRTIAGRYVVERIIGHGGMAIVAAVRDERTGQHLALKRMRQAAHEERARELFEREYRTLMQLDHPRIIKAIDYGVEDSVPFYTMELLDGGDLVEHAPMPWKRACAVARDVCSALSLVHARKMVYRDLSPRNVRCTEDGQAKLLDFGAMAPVGSAKFAVCTPAVAAPEVLNMQSLDARTDLYALGATLYMTLTGQPAYPATSFRQLELLWSQPLRPPSALNADIPEALDSVVMDLLQLDASVRPASAAEVSQRLGAIAGLGDDVRLVGVQAYLQTPTMVGRSRTLERVHRGMQPLKDGGRGAAVMLRAQTGLGLTRMLDGCVLQAKLDGLTVLRVTGDDAGHGGHAAAQVIADQLLAAEPESALEAASEDWDVLARLLPALAERNPERPPQDLDNDQLQARALPVLRSWLFAVADRHPMLLAVDDVERLDAESRYLLALVAEQAGHHPLMVLATRHTDRKLDCAALELLDASSLALELRPLNLERTESLLASIFGDVPNLQTLVHRLHSLSDGNPRRLMLLAQHLVDVGIIQHKSGTWSLPQQLDQVGAPASMADALQVTVKELGHKARQLARAIAATDDNRFQFEECVLLGADASALSELLAAGVLRPVGDGYRLAGAEWTQPLLAALADDDKLAIERALASVFESRGDGMRAARHLAASGETLQAVEVLTEYIERSADVANVDVNFYVYFLENMPGDWQEVIEHVLTLAEDHPRRKHVVYTLQNSMLGIVAQTGRDSRGHSVPLANLLAAESGLDIYASMTDQPDPGLRLQAAIGAAMERHGARPEAEQLFDPITAIRHLARTVVAFIGNISNSLNIDEWEQGPSLEPLVPLSPALGVVHKLATGFDVRRRGRYDEASQIYREILAAIAPPNDIGLERTYVVGMEVGISTSLGIVDGGMGSGAWQEAAERIAEHPLYEPNALLVRSIATLWSGDTEGAAQLERERERQCLERRRPQPYGAMGLLWRFQAYAVSEDVTGTARELQQIERIAVQVPSWRPIFSWARGEYERVRGDREAALKYLDEALQVFEPGRHQLWCRAAAARLLALCGLGRPEQALEEGRAQLAQANEQGLGCLASGLKMGLALAAAKLDDAPAAWEQVDAVLADVQARGVTGINLGLVYETAARVAVHLHDTDAFERYAPLCHEAYTKHPNRALSAKYGRLQRAAKRAFAVQGSAVHDLYPSPREAHVITQLTSILSACAEPDECMQQALELVVGESEASAAYLIMLEDGQPYLECRTDTFELPGDVLAGAGRRLQAEQEEDEETQLADSDDMIPFDDGYGDSEYSHLLLGHYAGESFLISGLLVLRDAQRTIQNGPRVAERLSQFIESGAWTSRAQSRTQAG